MILLRSLVLACPLAICGGCTVRYNAGQPGQAAVGGLICGMAMLLAAVCLLLYSMDRGHS